MIRVESQINEDTPYGMAIISGASEGQLRVVARFLSSFSADHFGVASEIEECANAAHKRVMKITFGHSDSMSPSRVLERITCLATRFHE